MPQPSQHDNPKKQKLDAKEERTKDQPVRVPFEISFSPTWPLVLKRPPPSQPLVLRPADRKR